MANTQDTENIENIENEAQGKEVEPSSGDNAPDSNVEQTESKSDTAENKSSDPEEYIIDMLWDKGKRELSTNDLLMAGFDPSRIEPYQFKVGKYTLRRLLTLSPYKLEKTE